MQQKNLMLVTISDSGTIVLFKKDFELDTTVNPPIVKEKPLEVVKTLTIDDIDKEIQESLTKIEVLTSFKEKIAK
jgi:hypothetical protein